MGFDATVLTALEAELKELVGSRVLKIYQPNRLELVLALRQGAENLRLLVSAHPERARLHLTTRGRPNPAEPPAFCMYLRRHLEGARLASVRRPEGERIVVLVFTGRDELGEPQELELTAELMGKHSNIILVNSKSGMILEAIKHVTAAVNRYREVLPGLPYRDPPAQAKMPLLGVTELSFYSALQARGGQLVPALVATLAGFSPLVAREVVARAGLGDRLDVKHASRSELNRLWQALQELKAEIAGGNWRPSVFRAPDGKAVEVAPFPLVLFTGFAVEAFPSMSAALDAFFSEKEEEERVTTFRQNLLTLVKRESERVEKRLALRLTTIEEAKEGERYRHWGELLYAHAYHLPARAVEVEVDDWEQPGACVHIPLDPHLTINENAARYFNRFNKAKKTLAAVQEQAAADRAELAYLDSISLALEEARDLNDLEEVRAELEKEGYLKKTDRPRTAAVAKTPPAEHLTYLSSAGWTIWVGRNNRQNDRLTLRLADPHDLWLHTQNIPGAHVVIRCPGGELPPEETIREAAVLAAYHSKARHSSQVPVDYTLCRYVRKPSGAKPGFVIYDHQRTIFVTPTTEAIEALRRPSS